MLGQQPLAVWSIAADYLVLSQEETPLLYSLVFGEGVVNDATSVVLFNAVQKINADTINGLTALHIFLNFLYLFTTSTLLGVGAGLVTAYILRGLYFSSFGTRMEIYGTVMFLIALRRAAFVFPLSILSNYMHRSGGESSKISGHHQFTHSGVTMDPTNATMITTTIVIVLFSTIVFGFMTKPLVDYLIPQTASSTKRNPNPYDPGSPKEDMRHPLLSLEESASENYFRWSIW
nr:sodium/hydrogen exchanger 4-like isoform X2 [Tanacetum cinerariifolium]